MKTFVIFIVLFLDSFCNVYSQSNWVWQNPTPTGNDLFDFQFTDSNTCYIASDNFSFLKTTDSGENWDLKYIDNNLIPTGVNRNLKAVYFLNSLTGYVGGNGICKTTDGGETWTYSNTGTFVNSIYFTNLNTGYAACDSGKIIKTIDGGYNWFLQYTIGNTTNHFTKIKFISQNTGFVVGEYRTILKTTNQGENWVMKFGNLDFQLFDIDFINNSTGFVAGRFGIMLKTTNVGEDWTYMQFIDLSIINSIDFISPDTGYVVANGYTPTKGKIYFTTTGGIRWIMLKDIGIQINKISFTSSNNGVIICEGGNLYKSTNLGISWISKVNKISYSNIKSVSFVSNEVGFAAGSNNLLLKTTSGGLRWQNIYPPMRDNYVYIKFFDNNNGYLAGSKLYKTSNSGLTWHVKANLNVIHDIKFYNLDTGYYLKDASDEYLYRTFDGGESWISNDTEFGARKFIFLNNNDTGYLITSYMTYPFFSEFNGLFKTTNNGLSWQRIHTFEHGTNAGYLNFIYFVNSQTGFLSGAVGIKKTTNAGMNWTSYPGLYGLTSEMFFCDENTGYVSKYNMIYKTTNSGNNWFYIYNTSKKLNAYSFTDLNTGYVVGEFGNILKTTNGGINVNISNEIAEIPSSIYLYQNYPNPFNPTTKIEFELPKNYKVKLIVYNILGKEIKTIVNTNLSAGRYSYDFDGINLPSGIYFYKLETEEYFQIKKMILIK